VSTEIIVAAIGAVSTVTASYISYQKGILKPSGKIQMTGSEMSPRGHTGQAFLMEWTEILAEIRSIMQDTSVDRFVIFEGMNGRSKVRKVTAFFQLRSEGQRSYKFKNFAIDDDYREMLERAKQSPDGLYLETSEMEDCRLRRVYETEGVTSAVVHHLSENEEGDRTKVIF